MPVVAVLHHLEEASSGHAGPVLAAAGVELDERELPRGDPLPDLGAVDGVLCLGGRQSARDPAQHAWMPAEIDLIRAAVVADVPFLGVCLGGQLLARAAGGEVSKLDERRIGWPEVERLDAAAADPLFGSLPGRLPALHWNEDYFTVPAGATELLSRSATGGEAIRVGERAWGIQFHPEADGPLLEEWYERGADALAAAGVTEADARAADARHAETQRSLSEALFGGFARVAGA